MADPIKRAKNGDTSYFKRTPVEQWMRATEGRNEQLDILSVAITNFHVHCAKVIYRRCPELLHRRSSSIGFTVLHQAVIRDEVPSLIKFVISVADSKLYRIADNYINTPFTMSIEHNRFHAFELMAEAEPDLLSYIDENGKNPLWKSQDSYGTLSNDDLGKFRELILEKYPESSKVRMGEHGWTPLHRAASTGDIGSIKDIIRYCPESLHVVDNEGRDFVDIAMSFEHSQVVKKVLQKKEIWDSILKGNNTQGIDKLIAFISDNVANTMSKREKELCIPPKHLVLYRELVNQFGEIVDPSKRMQDDPVYEALGCFLDDMSEMIDVKPGNVYQEETIANWEKIAAQYSSMGLQVSWFQKLVDRYSDWFVKREALLSHFEDEIAIKEAKCESENEEYDIRYSELEELGTKLEQLGNELEELKEQRDTCSSRFDPFSVIWQISDE